MGGIDLLEKTMESLETFINKAGITIHVAFDEFQEITEINNAIGVECILRKYIQRIQSPFYFIGSRRRILLEIFNERKRPFFQSAINYELTPLPKNDMIQFIQTEFRKGKKKIIKEYAAEIADIVAGSAYYLQKFCFFLYDHINDQVKEGDIALIKTQTLQSEKYAFEGILQGLTVKKIALLQALARDPHRAIFSAEYILTHYLGSAGGVQRNIKLLSKLDLIEKDATIDAWKIVDPFFNEWLNQ